MGFPILSAKKGVDINVPLWCKTGSRTLYRYRVHFRSRTTLKYIGAGEISYKVSRFSDLNMKSLKNLEGYLIEDCVVLFAQDAIISRVRHKLPILQRDRIGVEAVSNAWHFRSREIPYSARYWHSIIHMGQARRNRHYARATGLWVLRIVELVGNAKFK